MSKIGIIGGTGYAGGAIAKEARSRGHEVVIVARHEPESLPEGAELRVASIFDDGVVDALAKDVDTIVVALPHREIDGAKLADALPALLEASRATGVRLGFVGGAGSSLVAPGGPRLVDSDFPEQWKPEALAAAELLEALRASEGASWFVISPAAGFGSFAPGERTGKYRKGGDVLVTAEDGTSYISGADYAIAFVDEIESKSLANARTTVGY